MTSADHTELSASIVPVDLADHFDGERMASVVSISGDAVASLEMSVIRTAQFLAHPIVASNFGISPEAAPFRDPHAPLAILGSLSSDIGGVQHRSGSATALTERASFEAIRLSLSHSVTKAPYAVAVNVPSDQVDLFARCAEDGVRELYQHSRYVLDLPRGGTEESFLASLNSKTRRTWLLDTRADLSLNFPAGVESPGGIIAEAAPMIADVRRRNGVHTHPLLVELELERWAREHAPTAVVFTRRNARGKLIAACLASVANEQLHLYDVGLTLDERQRGVLYRMAVFLQPLRFAIAHGLHRVHLGYGHDLPKSSRGATGISMHSLLIPLEPMPSSPGS